MKRIVGEDLPRWDHQLSYNLIFPLSNIQFPYRSYSSDIQMIRYVQCVLCPENYGQRISRVLSGAVQLELRLN